jgi:hypothetical protein
MDVNKVSHGQRIAAIAGALLFIDLWMSWYSVNIPGNLGKFADLSGIDTTASAWQAFSWTDIFLAITALVAIAGAVMAANAMTNPLPIGWAQLTAGLGGIMTLLVLYRIVNQPGPNKLVNVEWGAYVGLILVALVAYGGWRAESDTPATPVTPAAPPPPAPAGPTV